MHRIKEENVRYTQVVLEKFPTLWSQKNKINTFCESKSPCVSNLILGGNQRDYSFLYPLFTPIQICDSHWRILQEPPRQQQNTDTVRLTSISLSGESKPLFFTITVNAWGVYSSLVVPSNKIKLSTIQLQTKLSKSYLGNFCISSIDWSSAPGDKFDRTAINFYCLAQNVKKSYL